MAFDPTSGPPLSSLDYARARDRRIEWLIDSHPVTAAMLVQIGWFPTQAKALRRLRRLVAKRRIRFVGTVGRGGGRPAHVFCRWRPKGDDLLHEAELTELYLRLDASRIVRGAHVTDPIIRPDAEVWIDGRLFYLEHDRGTLNERTLHRRLRAYEGFPHFVLWVCPTPGRRDALRQRAERLRHCALFTTFAEAIRCPHDPIWLDYHGERVSLPRSSGGTPGAEAQSSAAVGEGWG